MDGRRVTDRMIGPRAAAVILAGSLAVAGCAGQGASTVFPSSPVAEPTPVPTASPSSVPTVSPSSPPVAAPTQGKLLIGRFVSEAARGYGFTVLDLATGIERPVGTGLSAAWSGDGTRVNLVAEDAECIPRLETRTSDGGRASVVTSGLRSGDHGFAWSPDGRQVAFVRYEKGQPPRMCGSQGGAYPPDELVSDVIVMRADGTSQRVLQEGIWPAPPLTWSPDGRSLAFFASDPSTWQTRLTVINAATVDVTVHRGPEEDADSWSGSQPAWSPDGSRLAYEYGTTDREGIGIVAPATGVATEVDGWADGSSGPVWSPDGRWLAVVRGMNGGTLVLLDPEGVEPDVTLGVDDVAAFVPFSWSPDGRWLVYSSESQPALAVVPAAGSGPRVVATTDREHWFQAVAWQPDPEAQP